MPSICLGKMGVAIQCVYVEHFLLLREKVKNILFQLKNRFCNVPTISQCSER